jgi:2-iminobutanoate/2-iminopropanoate deaminase
MPVIETISDPANSDPHSRAYSDAMRAGSLLFLSGQMGIDPTTDAAGSIEEQTRQALENMSRLLSAAGATLRNVATVTVFLARNEDRAKMNDVYREFFTDHKPARATVAVQLGRPDLLIEIQAIAVLDA